MVFSMQYAVVAQQVENSCTLAEFENDYPDFDPDVFVLNNTGEIDIPEPIPNWGSAFSVGASCGILTTRRSYEPQMDLWTSGVSPGTGPGQVPPYYNSDLSSGSLRYVVNTDFAPRGTIVIPVQQDEFNFCGSGTSYFDLTCPVNINVHIVEIFGTESTFSLCPGESFDLSPYIQSNGSYSLQALDDGSTSGTVYTAGQNAGTHTVRAVNNAVTSEEWEFEFTVTTDAVEASSDDGTSFVQNAGTFNLSATIGGGSWSQILGTPTILSGSSFNTISVGSFTFRYSVTRDGCAQTDDATITVSGPAPAFTMSLGGSSISEGSDNEKCRDAGAIELLLENNGYTYSISPGADQLAYNRFSLDPASFTEYIIEGDDGSGIPRIQSFNLLVYEGPQADAGDDIVACTGVDTQLNSIGSSGDAPLSYAWTGTGIVSGAGTATPTINVNSDRSFTVTVTDVNGCTDTDIVDVTVGVANASAGTDKTICEGESVQLSASGGVTYSWSPATGLSDTEVSSPIASPTTTTTYTVTVTDGNGCIDTDDVEVTVNPAPSMTFPSNATICVGESVDLTASGATTYSWSPSTGLNVTNLATVTASPTVSTLYTITGTSALGCELSQSVIVNVNDVPTADAGDDQILCSGETIVLNGSADAGTAPYSYAWSGGSISSGGTTATPTVDPSANAIYTLTVTDANGCTATDQVRVDITSGNANAGTDRIICMGEDCDVVSFRWQRV